MIGALEASALIHAAETAELSRQNPDFWGFDGLRLMVPAADSDAVAERRRVFARGERLVIESGPEEELRWPILARRAPVRDRTGAQLGEVEIARSVRGLLLGTLLIALASFALGAFVLVVLRIVPMRLLRQALDHAAYVASHDVLTGLPSRNPFRQQLERALARLDRGEQTAVLFLDLDGFKGVNDTLGHPAGDMLLRMVAGRLRACLRRTDTVARFGGDEFAVILVDPQSSQDAADLASRIIQRLSEPYSLDGHRVSIGVSVGIALAPENADVADDLLKKADIALYRAKADGKGCHRFFEVGMDERLHAREALKFDLRRVLIQEELELHYQPLIDLGSGRTTGFEALLRWRHAERGFVSPAEFIPLAEESGMIVPIGEWVIRQACRDASTWPSDLSVAVNLSPTQFRSRDLAQHVAAALAEFGVPPQRLELEVTESVLLQDDVSNASTLHQLRSLGVRIALDDFGTGFSSLSYLRKFPFDKIKIDRSFIRDLPDSTESSAIVRLIVGLGRSLGITVLAEGVETLQQAECLRAEGCSAAQGFLFGRAAPLRELHQIVEHHELPGAAAPKRRPEVRASEHYEQA